jgi:hypothetical protein
MGEAIESGLLSPNLPHPLTEITNHVDSSYNIMIEPMSNESKVNKGVNSHYPIIMSPPSIPVSESSRKSSGTTTFQQKYS